MLTSARGDDDLLPWLTTRSEPVPAARPPAGSPGTSSSTGRTLDPADVVEVCDSLVRLTVSHLVLPLAPVEVIAAGWPASPTARSPHPDPGRSPA